MKRLILLFVIATSCQIHPQNQLTGLTISGAEIGGVNPLTDNAAFWIDTSNPTTMFKEGGGAGGNPTTAVTANGHTVGCIYDQSINSVLVRFPGALTQYPTLGSDATRNGYLTFDGSNDILTVSASTSHLSNLHGPSPSFSIYFWIKFNGGDAATQIIFTNNNLGNATGGGAGRGISLYRLSTNKLFFEMRNTANTLIYSFTSTINLRVAEGWQPVILSVNGTGVSKGRLVIGSIGDETFDVSAGDSGAAKQNLYIGARSSSVQWLNASIGDIIIRPGPTTSSLITAFKNYNPIRTSTEFTPQIESLYDFTDAARMFSDASETTPVTNGSVVRVVYGDNKLENFGSTDRKLTAASDGVAPIFRTNQVNTYSSIEFDGVDDNLDFLTTFCPELGGKYTVFLICRNTDATYGSHIMSTTSSGKYLVLTGENYSGEFSDPYFIVHALDAGDVIQGAPADVTDADFKIFVWRRNGLSCTGWNSDLVTHTSSISSAISFIDMGADYSGFPDWKLDGFVTHLEKWNGYMSDAQVEAKIDELKIKFGIN